MTKTNNQKDDVCYNAGKGYRQEGDYMVCNNCGQKFLSTRINEEKGGYNPASLDRTIVDSSHGTVSSDSWTQDGYLKIKKSTSRLAQNTFFENKMKPVSYINPIVVTL